MFEGKPPFAPDARVWKHGEAVDDSLCAVDWNDLKARLAAARDLRRELQAGEPCDVASFDADSARRLAAQHERVDEIAFGDAPVANGKDGVNPDDLANGKGVSPNIGRHSESGDPANRGNT